MICILDTESTGLTRDPDARPIELGAVILDGSGAEVSCFSRLMRPDVLGGLMADEARSFHGISHAEVLAAERSRDVLIEFHRWMARHVCFDITSFNVAFDVEMLLRAGWYAEGRWKRHMCLQRRAAEPMARAGALVPAHDDYLVTVDGIDYRPPKLIAACAFFGVQPEEPAHRALTDARTAAKLWRAMEPK